MKTLPAICRGCLSEGCTKAMFVEYVNSSGASESFADIFKETFNIQIEPLNLQTESDTICDDCVRALTSAQQFRLKVLNNQPKFVEHWNQLVNSFSDFDKETDTKLKEEPAQCCDVKTEQNHEQFDYHYEEVHIMEADDDGDDDFLSDMKLSMMKPNPGLKKPPSRRKRLKIETDADDAETGLDTLKLKKIKDWTKIAERRGNGPILRDNTLKLLANSTICVFQWNKSRYRCFCCKEPFSNMSELRHHTTVSHTLQNIEKQIIIQQNRLVKVEISSLFCKICAKPLSDLQSLRRHLVETHEFEFGLHSEDLLVPFNLESGILQCQLCAENFTVFRLLNIHMNKHYQKQVCHICGAGFSNLVFLNLHKTRSHRPVRCKECNLDFANRSDKKDHDVNVHNVKFERKLRFPCPFCEQRFFQENLRVQHLVEKHGMVKPEHKCSICSKDFITKSLCNNHVKNVHMKEKRCECDVCHMRFYTKSDVTRHRVTHTGEKNFSCNLCNNLFGTKDSLRRHLKRTHVNTN